VAGWAVAVGMGAAMKPNAAQLREMRRTNARFPAHLVTIPREQWPDMSQSPHQSGSIVLAAYRSKSFLVVVWLELNGFTRLSVNRTEWNERKQRFRDDISWDDLQRLKAEAGFGDMCALEVYPPDEHVVNVSNMRHVFLIPNPPPFMWTRVQAEVEAA
jgi:hypothetical protein